MEQVKVAYICTPIDFGGAEKVSLNFLRNTDKEKFTVCPIFLIRPWEEKPLLVQLVEEAGYNPLFVPVGLQPYASLLRVFHVVRRLFFVLRKGGFELVHTHGYFADICAIPLAKIIGIPILSTCHGFVSNSKKLRLYNKLNKWALRLCTTVIVVSEAMKVDLVQGGIKESRVIVMPNAVMVSVDSQALHRQRYERRKELGIGSGEFVVGYLGRLSEEKGVRFLVEALSISLQGRGKLKLVIVGDGPEKSALKKLTRDYSLDSKVIFAGFQANTEPWLPVFDLFVLPSLTEGTPMALLEAMAAGIPVVASAVGGVPSVVKDRINGLLVPPCRADLIAEKIELLINDHELRKAISLNAMDHIGKKYEVGAWCRSIERIYRDVIALAGEKPQPL